METASHFSTVLDDLVAASRILATHGVLDGFGHVSARHPDRVDRFFIPRMRAPGLVGRDDLVEIDLLGRPVHSSAARVPSEVEIHAAIYRARSDVRAVCHHHAPSVLPFCIAAVPLVPVFHVGAAMGAQVPLWDSRTAFGDTDLLVATAAQGDSLARALGADWIVLMRGHGATVAARNVRELAFRSIYGARNAALQLDASRLGPVTPLTAGEASAACDRNLRPMVVDRAWNLWTTQICAPIPPTPRPGGPE